MPESNANPLLSIQFRVPFDRIGPEALEPAIALLIEEARSRLASIAAEPGERTFANTMAALDRFTESLHQSPVDVVRGNERDLLLCRGHHEHLEEGGRPKRLQAAKARGEWTKQRVVVRALVERQKVEVGVHKPAGHRLHGFRRGPRPGDSL